MKKSELLKIMKEYLNKEVRRIIREEIGLTEIRKIVREEIEIAMGLKSNQLELQDQINVNKQIESQMEKSKQAENTSKKYEYQSFVKDSLLNDILNETAEDMVSKSKPQFVNEIHNKMGMEEEWSTLGMKTTADVDNPLIPHVAQSQEQVSVREMLPADRKGADVPDFLEKALTKDYSKLINMEPKRGKSLPGMGLPPVG